MDLEFRAFEKSWPPCWFLWDINFYSMLTNMLITLSCLFFLTCWFLRVFFDLDWLPCWFLWVVDSMLTTLLVSMSCWFYADYPVGFYELLILCCLPCWFLWVVDSMLTAVTNMLVSVSCWFYAVYHVGFYELLILYWLPRWFLWVVSMLTIMLVSVSCLFYAEEISRKVLYEKRFTKICEYARMPIVNSGKISSHTILHPNLFHPNIFKSVQRWMHYDCSVFTPKIIISGSSLFKASLRLINTKKCSNPLT
jgi:hypothetical protein